MDQYIIITLFKSIEPIEVTFERFHILAVFDDERGEDDYEIDFVTDLLFVLKKVAGNWDVSQKWYFSLFIVIFGFDQTPQDHALAVVDDRCGLHLALGGDGKSRLASCGIFLDEARFNGDFVTRGDSRLDLEGKAYILAFVGVSGKICSCLLYTSPSPRD